MSGLDLTTQGQEEAQAFLGEHDCEIIHSEDEKQQSPSDRPFYYGTLIALCTFVFLPPLLASEQDSVMNLLFHWERRKLPGQVGHCIWAPQASGNYKNTSCFETVTERIVASYSKSIQKTNLPPLRWLLFGDSTMNKLFENGFSTQLLTAKTIQESCDKVLCYHRAHSRCNLNEDYLFPPLLLGINSSWKRPDWSLGEGPAMFGLENANCQDCGGCNSLYAVCTRKNYPSTETCDFNNHNKTHTPIISGGYFSIEFARDVEVQTPQFLTTQENVAQFVQEHYNQDPWLFDQFGGRPVCVVTAGIHDVYIPEITLLKFLNNVEWWLDLLLQNACGHVVWLQSTAPLKKNANNTANGPYAQNQIIMEEWNSGVYQMLNETTRLPRDRITIVDVFEASRHLPHADNIHLTAPWYQALNAFFSQVQKTIIAEILKERSRRLTGKKAIP